MTSPGPTATYSGNPGTSPKDLVRFLLHDTDPANAKYRDDEIFFWLTLEPNEYYAAADLAEIQAGAYASLMDKTVGPLSIRYGEMGQRYYQLSQSLRALGNRLSHAGVGPLSISTAGIWNPHIFAIGMHDEWGYVDQRTGAVYERPGFPWIV